MSENETYKGRVAKVKVMEGSKSERVTHVLQTAKGDMPLRLKTSNPFYDPFFEQFEGQQVEVEGVKKVSYLQVSKITSSK